MKPVLIMGGSGQAGSGTATLLRQWHPELPLTIAGRDLDRARRVANELGGATAASIDLTRDDLGLAPEQDHSAVVAAVWDRELRGLAYAQQRGVPYLSVSNGLVDVGPEVIASAQRPGTSALLLASHVNAGVLVLATLDAARSYERIDSIRIGAVLDESNVGGEAALADLERLGAVTSAASVRQDGVFIWITGDETAAEVRRADGSTLPGQSLATPDVMSIALATGAPNVRLDFAVATASDGSEPTPAVEIRIELDGTDRESGTRARRVRQLVHPEQRTLTALGMAMGAERLLGLGGAEPVPPGLHTPESLLDPAETVRRMRAIGTTVSDTHDN